jgi:protein Mpv17
MAERDTQGYYYSPSRGGRRRKGNSPMQGSSNDNAEVPAPLPELTTSSQSQSLIAQNDNFSLVEFFKELYIKYKWYLQEYPIYTKSITSCTIAMLGEMLGSIIKAKKNGTKVKIDPGRVVMFGTFGALVTGPWLHFWYKVMTHIVEVNMNLTGRAKTLAKVLIDRCLWGPPYTFFTICFLTYFQCFSLQKTWHEVRNKYAAILIMSQKVWVPAQALNFEVIPQDFQVLFVNLINVGWNTYLSMANPNPV